MVDVHEPKMEWLQIGEPVRYQAGQSLFYAGHFPLGVFIIRQGSVLLLGDGAIEIVKAGECPDMPVLGLAELLAKSFHRATALAMGELEVTFLSRTLFQSTDEKG